MAVSSLYQYVRDSGIVVRAIGGFLVVSGVLKVIDPDGSLAGVYRVTESWAHSRLIIMIAVGVESALGVWSVLGSSVSRAALMQVLLLSVYSAYLAQYGFVAGWDDSCGCGLFGENVLGALLRNSVLVLALVGHLLLARRRSRVARRN